MPMAPSGTTHSPCGACKFLRRKCAFGCVFAPYFSSEQGPAQFAAIHKVFGASNISKLLHHLPVEDRYEAAVTIGFEAEARLQEPVYGCVAHIFALQQQVAYLQAQLIQVKAHMVCSNHMTNHQCHHHEVLRSNDNHNVCGVITSPVSSLDSNIDQSYSDESTLRVDTYNYIRVPPTSHHNQSTTTTTTGYKNEKVQTCGNKKRPRDEYGVGELHELALRMIRK